jgi:DNA polymerase epsilon subunit 1
MGYREFKLWLSMDGTFQSVRLRIPREFYLNFKAMPGVDTFSDHYESATVVRTLPRGQTARNLFRLIVDEALYVEGESHFASLINSPNVDGAYELQVPLIVRALINLGTACGMRSSALGGLNKGLDKGFDLSDLERPASSVIRHQYLDDGKAIRYHLLFHATVGQRHLIGFFSPGSSAKVYVVDNSRSRQQLPNPSKWYEERVERAEKGIFSYPDEMEFATSYYTTEGGAMKQLVKDLQAVRKGLNVIALCSPFEHSYYQVKSAIFSEYPFITFKAPRDAIPASIVLGQDSTRDCDSLRRPSR